MVSETESGAGKRMRIGTGDARELPDRRPHELIEDVAARSPDAIAVTASGADGWTYAELNAYANRVAHALLAGAHPAESVVAVITERTLPWAASVLGILKAGLTYLPIDPDCPADRVRHLLRQSRAQAVLAARDGDRHLSGALAEWDGTDAPRLLSIEDVIESDTPAGNPGVDVAPDDLAYIYFTSGSTGLPKGAMCEHLGMLNHLMAKIDVLGLGAGDVVAQNAPISFDISLWQLVAAWLVGGQTAIIAQEDILDVRRFRDELVERGTTIAQLVPSYLDVLLTDLDTQPGAGRLGAVRFVSVTGEAISRRLIERWFARYPGIPLVNAYGATEASDDTTHAVIDAVPATKLVPVGRPIRNVRVYIVDEQLELVPLGTAGEIVFSGICVGRGYINDPDRTAAAFEPDPHHPGARLYHSGDFGRWLRDGNLEFLGRRDEQIKVRGMRVELGEVERQITLLDGVRAASVIARKGPHDTTMSAFVVGAPDLSADAVLAELRRTLPPHLLPATCEVLDHFPVNSNGKVDKKLLAERASAPSAPRPDRPKPATDTERRLAAAWSEILGRPLDDIAADDDFFALGGDSLASVRLIVRLQRTMSLVQLMAHPVLRDLASAMDGAQTGRRRSLHLLAKSGSGGPTLVCVPDASGNAVNFQGFAEALAARGFTVYGVELAGHDIGRRHEPLRTVAETAAGLIAEVRALDLTDVMLWGQGTGAAVAVAAAHLPGAAVRAVFAGSHHIDAVAAANQRAAATEQLSDAAIKARIAIEYGYAEFDELGAERTRLVAAAYRHDTLAADRYFTRLLTTGRPEPMTVPLCVVVAHDDATTRVGTEHDGRWRAVSEHVSMRTLPVGGRHFHRSEPEAAAELVQRAAAAWMQSVA